MEKIRLFTKKKKMNWEYDEEADVLYISFGKPQEAIGIDVGEGTILRYSEKLGEIVGLTIYGIREHLFKQLTT